MKIIIQLIILMHLSLFTLGQQSEYKNELIKKINCLQEQNGNEKFLYNFSLEDKFKNVLKTQNIENLSLDEKRKLLVSNRIYDYDFIIEKLDSTLSEQVALERFYTDFEKEINQKDYNNIAILSTTETSNNTSYVLITKRLASFETQFEAKYIFHPNATKKSKGQIIEIKIKGQSNQKKMFGYLSQELKNTIPSNADYIEIIPDMHGKFQIKIDSSKYTNQKYILISDEKGNIIANLEI